MIYTKAFIFLFLISLGLKIAPQTPTSPQPDITFSDTGKIRIIAHPISAFYTHGGNPASVGFVIVEVYNTSSESLEIKLSHGYFNVGTKKEFKDKEENGPHLMSRIKINKQTELKGLEMQLYLDTVQLKGKTVPPNSMVELRIYFESIEVYASNRSNEYRAINFHINVGKKTYYTTSELFIIRREPRLKSN